MQPKNVSECMGREGLFVTRDFYWQRPEDHPYPTCYGELESDLRTRVIDEIPAGKRWYVHDLLCYSDYSGCLVHASNVDVVLETARAAVEAGELAEDTVVEIAGGYGTRAVAIRGDVECVEILEALCALADYPLLDECHHSQLECDAQDMAWDNGGFGFRADFARALEKRVEVERDVEIELDLDAPHIRSAVDGLAWEIQSRGPGDDWRNEQGPDVYIDVDDLAERASEEEIDALVQIVSE